MVVTILQCVLYLEQKILKPHKCLFIFYAHHDHQDRFGFFSSGESNSIINLSSHEENESVELVNKLIANEPHSPIL